MTTNTSENFSESSENHPTGVENVWKGWNLINAIEFIPKVIEIGAMVMIFPERLRSQGSPLLMPKGVWGLESENDLFGSTVPPCFLKFG